MTKTKDKVLRVRCFNLSDAQEDAVFEYVKWVTTGKPENFSRSKVQSLLPKGQIHKLESESTLVLIFCNQELTQEQLLKIAVQEGVFRDCHKTKYKKGFD